MQSTQHDLLQNRGNCARAGRAGKTAGAAQEVAHAPSGEDLTECVATIGRPIHSEPGADHARTAWDGIDAGVMQRLSGHRSMMMHAQDNGVAAEQQARRGECGGACGRSSSSRQAFTHSGARTCRARSSPRWVGSPLGRPARGDTAGASQALRCTRPAGSQRTVHGVGE